MTLKIDGEKLRALVGRLNRDRPRGDAVKAYKEAVALGFDMDVFMLTARFAKMDRARFEQFDRVLVAYLSAMEMR